MKLLKCDECLEYFALNDGYILTCPDDECKGERLFFCSKTCMEKHQFKVPITLGDSQSPEWILHYEEGKNHERALWKEKIQKRILVLHKQLVLTKPFSSENGEIWYAIIELEGLLK